VTPSGGVARPPAPEGADPAGGRDVPAADRQASRVRAWCLDDSAAEPTNNRAERDPGAIDRKVSCGNETERGKAVWKCPTSIAVTCKQGGQDFVAWLPSCLSLERLVTPTPAR
jgi:hypothetical protein